MITKTYKKKLRLNKKTISNLGNEKMNSLKGGGASEDPCETLYLTCGIETCRLSCHNTCPVKCPIPPPNDFTRVISCDTHGQIPCCYLP
jgi:hypothetical protein